MAAHSSTLAWRIPWTEEPGRLQSLGSQRVGHHWACTHTHLVGRHLGFLVFTITHKLEMNIFIYTSCILELILFWSKLLNLFMTNIYKITERVVKFVNISYIKSVCMLSCVQLFAMPRTISWQAPLSMEFSREEY